MYKYIVTWVLITIIPTPCPDAGKTDEFGRTSMYSCAVFHYRTERDTLSKEFTNRKLAFEFYNRVKKEFKAKIDSVKIK